MIKKTKNIKLDVNESAILEFVLAEWMHYTSKKKIATEVEADANKYNLDVVVSILNKISKAFKNKDIAARDKKDYEKCLEEWFNKNSKWFED